VQGAGQIAMLIVGTYAAKQLPSMLQQFENAGAAKHVGVIYLLEFDAESRALCMSVIPDSFKTRVVEGAATYFPVGFSNASVERVYENDEMWRKDVEDQAALWLSKMQADTTPGLLLALVSPGGMAGLGRPALDAFKSRYPYLPVYLVTILDNKPQIRRRFPVMRQLYLSDGTVRGAIVCDNTRNFRDADSGIACLFAGLTSASWVGDRPMNLWNSIGLVFSEDCPERVATLSVWIEQLPVYQQPHPQMPSSSRRYAKTDHLVEKALRGIRAVVEQPSLQALPLEPARDDSTLICLVIAPVDAEELRDVAAGVEQRLGPWLARTGCQLSIQFASIGAHVSETSEVPFSVILLQPIAESAEALDDLARGTRLPDAKFQRRVPYTFVALGTQKPPISTNGVAQSPEVPA